MNDLKGIGYLKNKLNSKKAWVTLRYNYYEQKFLRWNPSPTMPKKFITSYETQLGWCTKAVDSLANRLMFSGFEHDDFDLWEIFQLNNKDIFFDSAIRSALISACCFIYISEGEDGYPRLQVIDGNNATGIIDPITNLLKEGYAILDTDDEGKVTIDAYFTPEYTEINYINDATKTKTLNNTGYTLLVPIINMPIADKPFGRSRISKGMMNLEDKARWVITDMAVASEFDTLPKVFVLGTAQDSDLDSLKATCTSLLEISKDDEGDKPSVIQLQQGSMNPLEASLKKYAEMFAGLSGLTIDDLGFKTENPSSAESIKAGHGDLERLVNKTQDIFGSGFLNVGLVAACLRDQFSYNRSALYQTIPVWKPAFVMDNSAIATLGDGIIKINQAVPGAVGKKTIERMSGIVLEE